MQPHERLAYSAIDSRPPLKLPDGLRLILWPLMSLEQWDISRPMARMVITPPQGQPMLPDHPNWSWHEYGMRVGIWRLKKVFERLKMTPTVTVNGRACEAYPSVIKAIADAGWELNAHGYDQIPMHKVEDQLGDIKRAIDIVGKFWGRPPRGWFGPGLTQTFDTLDYLSQAGIEYIGDWVLDDEPVTLKTTHKPVVALPYNFELHDIVMMVLQNHPSEEFYRRSIGLVRMSVRGVQGPRQDHVDRRASVPRRPDPPHQACRAHLRGHPEQARRRLLERRENPRLVSRHAEWRSRDFGMSGFFVPHDLKAPLKARRAARWRASPPRSKDMYAIAGERAGGGNPDWLAQAAPAKANCSAVQKLLDAGATVIGKTICDEFFYSVAGINAHYGTPANIRAPGRIPGGSSSGSAAAVAAGACDFALGSDTGGSVRIPASLCGLYGIRTSHGRLATDGVMDMAPSFDTIGWFAASAGVLRKVGGVLLGGAAAARIEHLLIADDAFEQADEPVAALLRDALGAMAGALPKPQHMRMAPDGFDPWRDAVRVIQAHEIWQVYGRFVEEKKPRFGPGVAERMQAASKITKAEADAARKVHAAAREHIRKLIPPGTVVAMPSAPCIAPRIDSAAAEFDTYRTRVMRLTCMAGLGGLPQVSIPAGTVAGCPVGLSFIGWAGGDEALLDLAVRLAKHCGISAQYCAA